jgi:hypothetical protein
VPSGGSATSALTVVTKNGLSPGTYTMTIKGTSGSLTHSVQVQLMVTKK